MEENEAAPKLVVKYRTSNRPKSVKSSIQTVIEEKDPNKENAGPAKVRHKRKHAVEQPSDAEDNDFEFDAEVQERVWRELSAVIEQRIKYRMPKQPWVDDGEPWMNRVKLFSDTQCYLADNQMLYNRIEPKKEKREAKKTKGRNKKKSLYLKLDEPFFETDFHMLDGHESKKKKARLNDAERMTLTKELNLIGFDIQAKLKKMNRLFPVPLLVKQGDLHHTGHPKQILQGIELVKESPGRSPHGMQLTYIRFPSPIPISN